MPRPNLRKCEPVSRIRPINKSSVFAQNLVGKWCVLPGLYGGSKWYDLCGKFPGTLTGLNLSSAWSTSIRPGGWGSIVTDGTSSHYVDLGTPAGLASAVRAAYSGWIYRSGTGVLVGFGSANTAAAGTSRFSFVWYSDGNIYFNFPGGYCNVALSGTGWHYVVCKFDGSQATSATRLKVWIDGVAKTLSFTGSVGATLDAATGPWSVGRDASDRYCAGSYDDLDLYLGAISDEVCAGKFNESRLGNLSFFNRGQERIGLTAAAGGGGGGGAGALVNGLRLIDGTLVNGGLAL